MPPLAAAASTSSTRCGPFACRHGARQAPVAAANSRQGCGRPLVGRAAGLVGGGIAAAFFASLERCACVEVRTADDLVSDSAGGRDDAAPLMQHGDSAAGNRVTARKQSTRTAAGAGARKGRRGVSFGCCENIN